MRVTVELSGESLPLAFAELEGASEALGGRALAPAPTSTALRSVEVDLPDRASALSLAQRLALAYRCIVFGAPVDPTIRSWWTQAAASGESAAIRWQGHERRQAQDDLVKDLARAWVASGGTIDLDHPQRRFWLRNGPGGVVDVGEEVGTVDRSGLLARRMSRLPFSRPVGLDPRLARAAVNLARVRPGDRVVDPFVGTGALLAEAALLGARVTGVDIDPDMIRGAAQNFAHVGVEAESWIVGDAAAVSSAGPLAVPFDGLVTDVPYGRSAGTQGEPVPSLLKRVLPAWAQRVREGGRVVVVSASEVDALGDAWERVRAVTVRQHRSLTRIFSVYERRISRG